jgi:hypothetical protein
MSDKGKGTKAEQAEFWKMVFETFASSDMSIHQFCKQEGLHEWAFYSWRRKLANLQPPKITPDNPTFIEVPCINQRPQPLELLLKGGHILKIPVGIDRGTINKVFSALKETLLC